MVRKIITRFSDDDYHIFARIANDSGISVEEKLQEIVDIYIIVEKNRFKQDRLPDHTRKETRSTNRDISMNW
ncbi:MAG: hypothetical protein WD018_01230 [Nitrosopumilaceae archaeon]